MKIKHFFTVFLSFICLACNIAVTPVAADDEKELGLPKFPTIVSKNIVLMDADSGEVLYANNPDLKCYPASTTKLLTALLTIENCALTDTVTFSEAAVNSISAGDANASISVGEELTVEQALYCLILRSANEVAYGLAESVSGTLSGFATLMNSRVQELGAVNTHFTNASGLTDEFHYTTPYDMALIARACFNNKSLMKIVSHPDVYTIGPTNKSNFTRYYAHRYQMLPGGDYAYRYSLGGKTGYTDAAGNCLVSFAQKDDLRLICVVMNSTDADRYTDTISLFDYYFEHYKKIFLGGYASGLDVDNIDILHILSSIDSTNQIDVGFSDDAYLLVPNKVKLSELTEIVTYADNPAYSGKSGGFACISFYYNNIGVGNSTIYIRQPSQTGLPGANGIPGVAYQIPERTTNKVQFVNIVNIIVYSVIGVVVLSLIIFLIVRKKKRHRPKLKKLRF